MTVHAPFAFAPISRFVHFPEWAPLVSHDVPFKDGLCGTVGLSITARTPLLVGGPRRKATTATPGEVWPVRLPDGTYAIPGSSLQGLARAIIDVAAFGKLGPFVQARRYGVRDLTETETAKTIYRRRMTNKVKSGWLVIDGMSQDRGPTLYPCNHAKIPFQDIANIVAKKHPSIKTQDLVDFLLASNTEDGNNAQERLEYLIGTGKNLNTLDIEVILMKSKNTVKARAANTGRGPTEQGTLVVTGKPQASKDFPGEGHKKHEFFFYPGRRRIKGSAKGRVIDKHVWDDFILVHDERPGQDINPNWAFWKPVFEAKEAIPIFYIEEQGAAAAIGTASMFKLAHRLSTHDLLRNSTPDHFDEPDSNQPCKMDLGSLIFGVVADRGRKQGIKRRAAFDLARATTIPGNGQPKQSDRTVLLSPKPSYYPIYVRQPASAGHAAIARGGIYATYTPPPPAEGSHPAPVRQPELAGVKIWPTTGTSSFPKLPPPPENVNGEKATILLNALPAGTVMTTDVRVHNLRLVELGALLWALTFGRHEALAGKATPLRHSLGMGKPYQMGQVEIRLTGTDLTPNDPRLREPKDGWAAAAVAAFEAYMNGVYEREAVKVSWRDSAQVKALLEAADPKRNAGRTLAYMELGSQNGGAGTYAGERLAGRFLAPFVVGHEIEASPPAATPQRPSVIRESRPLPTSAVPPASLLQPVVGSRVRAKLPPGAEGVIVEMQPNGRARIRFDASPKPTGRNLADFDILSSPTAGSDK